MGFPLPVLLWPFEREYQEPLDDAGFTDAKISVEIETEH
jgi:hypothetical protein